MNPNRIPVYRLPASPNRIANQGIPRPRSPFEARHPSTARLGSSLDSKRTKSFIMSLVKALGNAIVNPEEGSLHLETQSGQRRKSVSGVTFSSMRTLNETREVFRCFQALIANMKKIKELMPPFASDVISSIQESIVNANGMFSIRIRTKASVNLRRMPDVVATDSAHPRRVRNLPLDWRLRRWDLGYSGGFHARWCWKDFGRRPKVLKQIVFPSWELNS